MGTPPTGLSLRREGPPLRIGRRGAAALAPENALVLLARAADEGVDLGEADLARVAACGVDGVVTDDPRIFTAIVPPVR